MIGIFVTFQLGDAFDEAALHRIAQDSRSRFEGMPALRSKAYTIDRERREAVNVYLWESADAARAFFTEPRVAQIAAVYGVRPQLRQVEVAALVDNGDSA